jgi:S1-C subfamily serine protease
VVGNADRVEVSIEGGNLRPATVTGYDSARDIALLTLDAPVDGLTVEIPKVNLVLEDLSSRQVEGLGYEVALVGFVPSISQTTPIATFGRIGALWNTLPQGFAYGQVDAAATNGMSGGPVFNKYAEFLGILVTSSSFDGNVRYLRFPEINLILEDLRNGSRR